MVKNLIRAPESTAVWESNIQEVRKRQPLLAQELEAYVQQHGHHFEHWENETPAGVWVEGLTEQPFFQAKEPPQFPWDKKKDKTDPLFFLYGVGTPPFLFQTIRSLPQHALSLVVIEPDIGLLAYTLHLTHVYQAMPQICKLNFYTLTDPEKEMEQAERDRLEYELMHEALLSAVMTLGIFTAVLAKTFSHPGQAENNEPLYRKISAKIREWVSIRLSNLGNSPEDTLLGLRQMALMTPWLLFGSRLTTLSGPYKGRPFICVAAGPSLEKNIHLLKEVQDRCLIVAADAVLKKLISHGITPHMVTALERGVATYDSFFVDTVERYPEQCQQIVLVTQSVCVPLITGRWPGPKIVIGKAGLPVDEWFNGAVLNRERITSGSSVAHMSYALACVLGASRVALIGQDLAFGEDGSTHASNTAREDIMQITKKSTQRYRLPGALGGEVESEYIWLLFLRIFEDMLAVSPVETWDCTEGGALIAGSHVHPLKKYLNDFVYDLEPFEYAPKDLLLQQKQTVQNAEENVALQQRFESAFIGLANTRALIGRIEQGIARTTAAAISPDRRVDEGRQVGMLLDILHAGNPVLGFIGQSYVYLGSIQLAQTRLMDTVEAVETWKQMHQEIVQSHKITVDFMEKWLTYADQAREQGEPVDFYLPADPQKAVSDFIRLVDREEAGEKIAQELNLLLARCDFARIEGVSPYLLWKIASHLMTEGRAEEARSYMQKAVALFDGQELPNATIAQFFRDYAQMMGSHDLCAYPDYAQAELLLANATEREPENPANRELLDRLLDARFSIAKNVLGDGSTPWLQRRAAAARALAGGDLPAALQAVWLGIVENWQQSPEWAASHIVWLNETLAKVWDAQDPAIRKITRDILQEMRENDAIHKTFQMRHSPEAVAFFAQHGIVLLQQLETAEMEQSATDSEVPADKEAGQIVAKEL